MRNFIWPCSIAGIIAGDESLLNKLDSKILGGSEKQTRSFLLTELQRLTRERLVRYGNTIFHLEPNVKEAPGRFA